MLEYGGTDNYIDLCKFKKGPIFVVMAFRG